jgi:hypothetical protein
VVEQGGREEGPSFPFGGPSAFEVPSETMSDHESVEEIERHNVRMARLIRDYWAKQGVKISLTGDPTKGLKGLLGPGALPRGYRGGDATPANKGR